MSKIYFKVEGVVIIKYTPVPGIANAYKNEVVMTKDIFRECYKKWINNEPETGHWIIMRDGKYSCDRCNLESPNNEKWDHCPKCGAIMINSREESEG